MAEEQKSESEKKKEDWMNSKWRPAMGWLYMGVCFTDFVLFPVLWSMLQTVMKQPITQWQPLTLQGAGLFHIAMGAVLGIAAMGRTQEKLAGANVGGATPSFTPPPPAPMMPAPMMPAPVAPAPSFGAAPVPMASAPDFGSPAPVFGSGKMKAPGQPDYPVI
jgi:hypothetical protein